MSGDPGRAAEVMDGATPQSAAAWVDVPFPLVSRVCDLSDQQLELAERWSEDRGERDLLDRMVTTHGSVFVGGGDGSVAVAFSIACSAVKERLFGTAQSPEDRDRASWFDRTFQCALLARLLEASGRIARTSDEYGTLMAPLEAVLGLIESFSRSSTHLEVAVALAGEFPGTEEEFVAAVGGVLAQPGAGLAHP